MSTAQMQGRSDTSEEIGGPQAVKWPPRTVLGYVDTIAEGLALLAFTAVLLITLLQVLARYVLYATLPWTEELARILFVASMMVGIALAVRRREHIVVDFLFIKLRPRGRAVASMAFNAAILVFLAVWLHGAILLMDLNASATYVTLPWLRVAYIYAVEAAAIVLMMVFVIADVKRQADLIRSSKRVN